MIDFSTFEAFKGAKPYLLLDQHPEGTYLAMQVEDMADIAAAIWSTETKRLVWPPEGACALSWLREGTQLAALQYPISVDEHWFALYSWLPFPLAIAPKKSSQVPLLYFLMHGMS